MRRFLFTLTFISLAGWSQPAQPQAQPPIVVQVQMPPESIWTALLKLAIPTILAAIVGSGITFYGVWLTNKRNSTENEANRKHQLDIERAKDEIAAEAKSRDNRWAFRKDVYVKLITSAVGLAQLIEVRAGISQLQKSPLHPNNKADQSFLTEQAISSNDRFQTTVQEFVLHTYLARLAVADDVDDAIEAIRGKLDLDFNSPTIQTQAEVAVNALIRLSHLLQAAGRKDLWAITEPVPNAEVALQG
jgi:hypothetical protein